MFVEYGILPYSISHMLRKCTSNKIHERPDACEILLILKTFKETQGNAINKDVVGVVIKTFDEIKSILANLQEINRGKLGDENDNRVPFIESQVIDIFNNVLELHNMAINKQKNNQ
jgi:hypothetical protein